MSKNLQSESFSAYNMGEDVPVDFAPIRAQGRGRVVPDESANVKEVERAGGRLRFWLLLLLVMGGTLIAANQYRGLIADFIAERAESLPAINMPGFNFPDLKRPVINRAINTVRMETPLHNVTEAEVRTLLARYTDSGFLGVDVQDLRDQLEQNPWIHSASVRRVWPDVLAIRIEEEVAVARWGEDRLLNAQGQVFQAPFGGAENSDRGSDARGGESIENLPLLSGPDGTEGMVRQHFEQFSDSLAEVGLSLAAISLNERGSWILTDTENLVIRLGREDMAERLSRFTSLYGQGLNKELVDAGVIDLRYSNGFSVSKRTIATDSVASR